MIGPNLNGQGGITSVVNTYIESEIFKKNEIIYLSAHNEGNLFNKIISFLSVLIRLPVYLINRNIKIVHIHSAKRISFYRKSIFVIFSKLFRKKVIMHIHSAEFDIFYENLSSIFKKYVRFILGLTTVLALSEEWEKKLKKITGKDNVRFIYNPVIIKKLNPKKKNRKINILFLGRLGKRKGTYDLIEASRLLNGDFVLKICGDGDILQINKIISDYNLKDKIKVLGWISGNRKKELFETADIYVLPSYNEGLPMSILEAMSYKIPVVSTVTGGIPEVVEHGKTGFLVEPGDVKKIAKYLNILSSNKVLRNKMGEEGFKKVKRTFDVKKISKQLNEIYTEFETSK
jgi:glycosyltransferase involved in cell wall biosynthesis